MFPRGSSSAANSHCAPKYTHRNIQPAPSSQAAVTLLASCVLSVVHPNRCSALLGTELPMGHCTTWERPSYTSNLSTNLQMPNEPSLVVCSAAPPLPAGKNASPKTPAGGWPKDQRGNENLPKSWDIRAFWEELRRPLGMNYMPLQNYSPGFIRRNPGKALCETPCGH